MDDKENEELDEDPSVPSELLDLYVQLEEDGVAPEEMSEAFK